MKKRTKRVNKVLLFVILLLIISIGYALLQTNLQINGISTIANASWDIRFENIQINNASVPIGDGDSAATINPNDNTEITYSVSLNIPGDFYEFNVDVKNYGTIDGMIDTITSTLQINNGDPFTIAGDKSNLPTYLDYSITYSDGTEILANHELKSGTKETYKIRVEFKRDISNSDLPATANTLMFTLSPLFKQATANAIPVHNQNASNSLTPGIRLVDFNTFIELGEQEPTEIQTFDNPLDAFDVWDRDSFSYLGGEGLPLMCLKYVKDNNDIVTQLYTEFMITEGIVQNVEGAREGIYELRGGIDESALPEDERTIFNQNRDTLKLAFGEANCLYDYDEIYECSHPDTYLFV